MSSDTERTITEQRDLTVAFPAGTVTIEITLTDQTSPADRAVVDELVALMFQLAAGPDAHIVVRRPEQRRRVVRDVVPPTDDDSQVFFPVRS